MMIVQFVFSERRKNIHHLLKSNLFFLVSCFVRNASPITYRISKIKSRPLIRFLPRLCRGSAPNAQVAALNSLTSTLPLSSFDGEEEEEEGC